MNCRQGVVDVIPSRRPHAERLVKFSVLSCKFSVESTQPEAHSLRTENCQPGTLSARPRPRLADRPWSAEQKCRSGAKKLRYAIPGTQSAQLTAPAKKTPT